MNASSPPVDQFGRRIDYLRISLTERCDLRCAYCRPGGAMDAGPDVLSADDAVAIATAATGLGISRVRLTGGEPLLRDDLEAVVSRISRIPEVADLSLTTNGQKLAGRARGLAAAGLHRVNVSLDSLDGDAYRAITGGGSIQPVLDGIDAALAAGISPVKLNVVLASKFALGDGQIDAFAALVREKPVFVRFIEAMPACAHVEHLPATVVLDRLSLLGELTPAAGPEGGGPATYYRLGSSVGAIGVIAPFSAPFCDRCNRLRVTARGELRPCLLCGAALDLRPALRSADPVTAIAQSMLTAIAAKPSAYTDGAAPAGIFAMHAIGG